MFQSVIHVVLGGIHVEVQQAHPVEPRLEFALCWSDAKGFGWVGEKVVTLSHFGQDFSLAKMARYNFSYLLYSILKHEF